MFSRILVPLDGSPESKAALPVARGLAQITGGSIWLLRVARHSHLPGDHAALHAAAESIERIASEFRGSGIDVHPVTREGEPAREILALSHDVGAELIIMRTHGRAGLERAVFGSVAEEVLKKADVPLLLVRPGGGPVTHFRRLLIPVDGSAEGLIAVEMAEALASATGASMQVLQVVVPVPMLAYTAPYDPAGASYYDPAWDDDALIAARTYVQAISDRLRERGHVVEANVRVSPSVPQAIDEAGRESNTDLIIMSTHALTGPARTVLGSVADAVTRTSPCPVLLINSAHAHTPILLPA